MRRIAATQQLSLRLGRATVALHAAGTVRINARGKSLHPFAHFAAERLKLCCIDHAVAICIGVSQHGSHLVAELHSAKARRRDSCRNP